MTTTKSTTTITITYKAFSNNERPITSATIEVGMPYVYVDFYSNLQTKEQDEKLCDLLFHNTNTYQGTLWNLLEPQLPSNRTHTALSVGDEITFVGNNQNGDNTTRTYRCDVVGWELVA